MRKELIETGKSVDAAIDAACEKLGIERENCEWEIIDLPRKGFLGLKNFPAKVKVSIEVPDPPKPKIEPAPQAKAAPQSDAAPRAETAPPAEPSPQRQPAKAAIPKAAPAREARRETRPFEEDEPVTRTQVTEGFTSKEILAMDYIGAILRDFGLTAQLELSRSHSGICVNITGEGLGSIIGRRGETLDAIQYLVGLVANRSEGDYLRVTVDCGNYRGKRKETLEALARKLAAQVLKTNVSKTLEPMNPFERRVIHATVSKIQGVTSSSTGEEPNRRVVITSPTARKPAPSRSLGRDSAGRDHERDRGGRGGDRRPPRDRDRSGRDRNREDRPDLKTGPSAPPRPTYAHQGPPKETPESAAGGELYGKVDLE